MVDKNTPMIKPVENPSNQRLLSGLWLWLARGGYLVLFLFILYSQLVGAYEYFNYTQRVLSPAWSEIQVTKNEKNQFEVNINSLDSSTSNYAKNYLSGIENGDLILSIDGVTLTPETTIETANTLLEGAIGESVTISVLKSGGNTNEYTIVRLKVLVDLLGRFSITPWLFFWFLYWVIVILLFSTTLVSVFIFRVRTADWMVIIVATAILLLPYTLNEFVDFIRTLSIPKIAAPTFLGIKIGSTLLLIMMYIFPDGLFRPTWVKWLLISTFLFTPRLIGLDAVGPIFFPIGRISPWIWMSLLAGAAVVQIYKYKKISTLVERQQIKWAMIGTAGIIIVLSASEFLSQLNLEWWIGTRTTIWESIFFSLRNLILVSILLLFSCITFAISIYRFRLWDADFYINRTLIYGLVTGILALSWTITIALIQFFLQQFTHDQSPLLAAVLSSIQVAALFTPVRTRVEKWVNERFYKDRVNFVEAIVELQAEKWQFISSKDMFQLIVSKTPRLIKSISSAIYLSNNNDFRVLSTYGVEKKEARKIDIEPKDLGLLKKGRVVKIPNEKPFALLVPLTVPRGHVNDLVGILALGPREEDRGYSRDHISDLTNLGKSAGVAIHFLQLNEKKNIT